MTQYIIITPARDEADYLEQTILSVTQQSVLPRQWILVNDGSRDRTGEIMDHYARLHPWITVCHRNDRGFRNSAGGEIDAFYEGFSRIASGDWEFIIKLDGDLSFSPDYFEKCFAEFANDPKLGIGGGGIYHELNGQIVLEKNPIFHVRGATKIYRRECWDAIGGVMRITGWDTVDELKANMLGWKTRSFAELRVLHHRYTGAADGAWKNAIKDGRANYIVGYHPLFMMVKCAGRVIKYPWLVGSVGLMLGFLRGYWNRTPQVQDRDLIRYTRNQQMRRLFLLDSIWK
jgi:glycosyltransferase involved in cell wall biosynthesis